MLELEEARARLLAAVPAPIRERVPLRDALGRVLTERIRSPISLPPFDNSAMDGYAVRADDVAHATSRAPVILRVVEKVSAGEVPTREVLAGSCVRLFTGSPLPPGADAVVMQEDTLLDSNADGHVRILCSVAPGENVRLRGEDVREGAALAEAGDTVGVGRISLFAAAGLDHVPAGRRPVVGVVATGSELVEAGQPLRPGQIYDSNRAALVALVERAGGIPRLFPLVADVLSGTSEALAEAFNQCDAVVTSGGVSVGEMDFLKAAFERIGGELEFWKVAIKPGRPFVFGRLRGRPLFGLPGNPVSAVVTFVLLVRPVLLRWQGAADVSLPSCRGVLTESLANNDGRRHFMRVKLDSAGTVHGAGIQASHMLSSVAGANGLVEVAAHTVLAAGTAVEVLRWDC